MKLTIIAFGQLTDIIGSSVSIENIADTDGLTKKLLADYPVLAGIKYRIAVNKKIINTNTILNDKTAIALLPPFSGG
jgi:molybdopterin synthase sulfur carrier subunit